MHVLPGRGAPPGIFGFLRITQLNNRFYLQGCFFYKRFLSSFVQIPLNRPIVPFIERKMTLFSTLTHVPKKYPFLFAVGFTAFKTGSVDLIVQKFVDKNEKIDWRRFGTFFMFGVCYQGAWQFLLFNRMMPHFIPNAFAFAEKPFRAKLKDVQGMKNVLWQNFVENGINNPFLFFPCFYSIKEFMHYKSTNNYGDSTLFSRAMVKYRANFWSDVKDIWSVWVPAQTINFAFSPAWLRVPFVACVSAGWTAYISITKGKANTEDSNEIKVVNAKPETVPV